MFGFVADQCRIHAVVRVEGVGLAQRADLQPAAPGEPATAGLQAGPAGRACRARFPRELSVSTITPSITMFWSPSAAAKTLDKRNAVRPFFVLNLESVQNVTGHGVAPKTSGQRTHGDVGRAIIDRHRRWGRGHRTDKRNTAVAYADAG